MRLSAQQLQTKLQAFQNEGAKLNAASAKYMANRQGRLDVTNPHAPGFDVNKALPAYQEELRLMEPLIKQMENLKSISNQLQGDQNIKQSMNGDNRILFRRIFEDADEKCSPEHIDALKKIAQTLSEATAALSGSQVNSSHGSAVAGRQSSPADLEQSASRLPELSSDIVTPTANTVAPPALDSITPATRTSQKNWFQRLSTTEKVFAAPAIAVAALAGAAVVSALIFAHKAITAPISWPMLIAKLAGVSNYENLRNNKPLCTLLGPSVVNSLTSASRKKALVTLTLQMGFVAACIATSGTASVAFGATMLVTAYAAGAAFICDEATSWADLAVSNTRRSVFPTTDNSPPQSPLAAA